MPEHLLREGLTEPDLDHLRRFRREDDRRRVATGRVLLRAAAAHLAGIALDDVTVVRHCIRCGAAHGAPTLVLPRSAAPMHGSVSHAGAVVLVAVSAACPVGVDAERVEAVGFEGFDATALTAAERETIASLPPAERNAARATAWVQKEAVLKMQGLGMATAPDRVQVGVARADARLVPDPRPGASTIALMNLAVGDGYRACVACRLDRIPVVRSADGSALLAGVAGVAGASGTTMAR
jgi:4'-phosphopantetheinyl transferase